MVDSNVVVGQRVESFLSRKSRGNDLQIRFETKEASQKCAH